MEKLNATTETLKTFVDKDAQLMSNLSLTLKNSMRNEKSLHKIRENMGQEFERLAAWETNTNISGLYKEAGQTYKAVSNAHLEYVILGYLFYVNLIKRSNKSMKKSFLLWLVFLLE